MTQDSYSYTKGPKCPRMTESSTKKTQKGTKLIKITVNNLVFEN